MFITFEGIDGSGKSTTLKLLSEYLKSKNVDFILTREPGAKQSKLSKMVRKVLLSKKTNISPMNETLLYSVDRRLHLENVIWPALEKKQIVLCDRYLDSTLAYQGFGRKLGIDTMLILQKIITNDTLPNITFFFDINYRDAKIRVNKRGNKDRFEIIDDSFFENVYLGYQKIISMFPDRFKIINASQDKMKVFEDVKKEIDKILKLN